MIDYLKLLLKNIDNANSKEIENHEIYSNSKLINVLKIIKIKEEKHKNNSFNKIIDMIKSNYKILIEIIDDTIEKLDENITSVPFTIKCVSNIIEQLLTKKYYSYKKKIYQFIKNIYSNQIFSLEIFYYPL